MRGLRISVLGPLEVTAGDEPVALSGRRPRELLTVLALRIGRPASAEMLAASIYGDPLPKTATESVRMHVTALRRAVGKANPDLDMALRTSSPGYVLDASLTQTDLIDAERLVDAAEQAVRAGDPANAFREAEKAVDLWRGEPLREFEATPFGIDSSPALLALHSRALKILGNAALSFGPAEIDSAITRLWHGRNWHPWDEALVGLLARCQYRAGHQQAALQTLADHRVALISELGLDPSTDLLSLERRILQQDPTLSFHVIHGASAPSGRTGRVLGRDVELSSVARAIADPAVRLVLVGGPAGIGKSTVLHETATRCAAMTIMPRADDGPYDGRRRALRLRANDSAHGGRGVFGDVRPSAALIADPLLHQLRTGPEVIVVDDADQLDDGTVSILRRLVLEPETSITLIMGSRRPGTLLTAWVAAGADLRVVHLQDMDAATLAAIARERFPQLGAGQISELTRRAGGSPGRMLELAQGSASPHPDSTSTPRLGADARRVVEAVAALFPVSVSELSAVLRVSSAEVSAALGSAAEQGLVSIDSEMVTLTRHQAAHELAGQDRFRLHRALAAYLASSIRHSDAVRRGDHLLNAGDTVTSDVVADGLIAGTRSAITLGWFDTAARLVEAGLTRPDLEPESRLTLRLEGARISIARDNTQVANEELRMVFLESFERRMADLAAMSLLCLQSLGVAVGGDDFLLTSWSAVVAELLPEPGELRTKALCGAAYASLTGEQPDVAAEILDRAEPTESATPTEVAMVCHARLLTSRMSPDPEGVARVQLARLQAAALLRSEPEIEVRLRLDRVIVALDEGDVETASASLRGAAEMADELGHPQARWISRAAAASVALCSGDFDLAAARSIEAAQIGTALGVPETVISGAAFQLALHERRGELPQLRPLLEAMSDPPDTIAVAWHSGAALAALAVGDGAGAHQHWSRIRDRARIFKPSLLAVPGDYLAAEAASAVGDLETARLLADRLRPIADRFVVVGSAVAVFGPVARVLALVAQRDGDPVGAAQMWELNDRLCERGALAWHTEARR